AGVGEGGGRGGVEVLEEGDGAVGLAGAEVLLGELEAGVGGLRGGAVDADRRLLGRGGERGGREEEGEERAHTVRNEKPGPVFGQRGSPLRACVPGRPAASI